MAEEPLVAHTVTFVFDIEADARTTGDRIAALLDVARTLGFERPAWETKGSRMPTHDEAVAHLAKHGIVLEDETALPDREIRHF